MSRLQTVLLAGLVLAAACSETQTPTQPSTAVSGSPSGPNLIRLPDGELARILPLRNSTRPAPVGQAGTGILYHGGPILSIPKVAAMYWGSAPIYAGGPAPGTTGTGAQDGSLIGYFLGNLGGSPHWNINSTYTDTVGGGHSVPNSLAYTQFWANNVNVPPSSGTPVSDKLIKQALTSGFTSGKLTYDPNTIYVIFSGGKTNLGGGFGTQYCAYHTVTSWQGKRIIYAVLPFNSAFRGGCTFRKLSPNGDQPADDEMPSLVHEIEEAATDPYLNAWYDAQGNENADKCANVTGTTYITQNGGVANINLNGRDFLVQQNWVNAGSGGCVTIYP